MAGSERICVGAIGGAFGVKGEVRLKSFCADPAAIADYAPLYSEDGKREFDLVLTGILNNGLSARMSGITTREQAEAARGIRLFADRARLPSLPDDEFYHTDLIGLTVLDTGGTELGKVKAVLNHGASDLLEIMGPGMKSPLLLPFTLAVVPTVDLAGGRMIVDPPEEV
ncbi:ribosome maturation factor RimM [Falsigemmobacter intermedius]|uniref:Ribosome maturation factor RimM n=1 Tax=Falsigemmobacter intermedius TaxID=1553448 RepID=A0A3S3UL62_9RHOB|nr:ribosome maturation factor RimM [Falsigemmobacter intermedius]RWY45546.1 16S rRNA processing protein RimM [Falsigemmobacter intermedius]